MLPKLKVAFSDFWHGLKPENNFFTDLLRTRFTVEISSNPDVLFCSTFGNQWKNFTCPRILVTGENIAPDPRYFDASLSFEPSSGTNYYLPLYRLYESYPQVYQERRISQERWAQKKAVGTVFSNIQSKFRTWAFHEMSRAVFVGSGGRAFNNVGGPVPDKSAFLKGYRFSMAFENTRWPGYTTEKLMESYASDTVPLYWGDPMVGIRFNTKSFLLVENKVNFPQFLSELIRIENDYEAYKAVYEQPLFPKNNEPEFLKADRIADFLENAVVSGKVRSGADPVSGYQEYRWSSRWRFKEWDFRKRPLIQFLSLFTGLGYFVKLARAAAKRLVSVRG